MENQEFEFNTLQRPRLIAVLFGCLIAVMELMNGKGGGAAFFGLLIALFCGGSFLFNRNAYFCLTATGIDTRFGWRCRLRCPYAAIQGCGADEIGLHIACKDGKQYRVFLLKDPAAPRECAPYILALKSYCFCSSLP